MSTPPRSRSPLRTLALLLPYALLTLALFTVPLCADDFWYATFWREGIDSFLSLSIEHYQTFNGRALVHAAAQSALALGVPFCAVCLMALLLSLALLGPRLLGDEPLPVAALFFPLVLTLPQPLLREGLFWISAAFNYLLPTALAVTALWLWRLWTEDRLSPPARAAALLCFVAAGATTEQIGLALAATLALTAAVLLCRRRARPLVALLPPLLTASGAATVLLSPATFKRAEEAAVTAPLFQNIPPFAASLAGILPHLALAVLALGLWAARDERCPRVLRLCLAAAPLSLLLSVSGAQIPAALTVLVPLAAALLLLSGEWLWTGALCLLASLTALVMLPTGVAEPRVLLPTALLASLLAACLLRRALAAAPFAEGAALTAALLLSTALFLPTLDSCLANARLTAKNEAAIRRARESGRLLYDFGYDRRTCHALITDDGFFYRTFLAYHDLEEVEVCLTAAGTAPLFTPDGQRLRSPALREGGRLFFPVRDTVEALGGTVSEEEGRTVFRIGDEWAVLQGEHLYCPVGPEQLRLSLKGRRPTRYFAFAVPAEVLEETLGVRPVPQGEGFVMTPVDG